MDTDNLQAAPTIANADTLCQRWQQSHPATADDFYRFITTPSAGRTAFIGTCNPDVTFIGIVAVQYVDVSQQP